jgi:hypothetical protein
MIDKINKPDPIATPNAQINLEATEDVTITLKGFTVGFLSRMIEEAPLPRAAYTQISQDFTQAIIKAKAPK